jgi:hypothetical protein
MIIYGIYRESGKSPTRLTSPVKAKTLSVVATQDQMVNPALSVEPIGDCGHMATGSKGKKMNKVVRSFLNNN